LIKVAEQYKGVCKRVRAIPALHDLDIREKIIDPKTMQPKSMGEAGELVITTLTKEALPMLRYRTRDITRLSDEPCPCGRSHVRILRVTGRNDDMLIIRGVNLYP
jgi:phenylacetate-CoA ligase